MRVGPAIAALAFCFASGLAAATLALGGVPAPDPPPEATTAAAATTAKETASAPTTTAASTDTTSTTATTGTGTTPTDTAPPLTVTPPLGLSGYVFPIAGDTQWGDSYGVPRPDVPSGWHHGDDLFAALGTPLVAVADGTLSDVGWEKLGGWRLWLTDSAGNTFYYAHLAGFTPLALAGQSVHAGDVLGYVGNTGDADGGASHLHFEIHPASLRSLGEDGAVDPTSYLASWRHLDDAHVVKPVLPSLPDGDPAERAKAVFAELLAVPAIHEAMTPRVRHRRVIHRRAQPAPEQPSLLYLPPRVAPRPVVTYRPPPRRRAQPVAVAVKVTPTSDSRFGLTGVAAAAAGAVVALLVPLRIRRRLRRRLG